ncbi:unnamed protein product [Orchesella dallaii]|uniref:Uncharacterized protein n=1 Tax=Orchesella dallaii TaxID=48710 RepID=A0ABP1S720_9HEXA
MEAQKVTQNILNMELKQSTQKQDEVELLYPTYSDLMGENRELKKWNNDLLIENEEAKKELQNTKRERDIAINQRLIEAQKDFWFEHVVDGEKEKKNLREEKKVMEDELKTLKGKLLVLKEEVTQKLAEVSELKNKNEELKKKNTKMKDDAKLAKTLQGCFRTWWYDSKKEVEELMQKLKEKEEAHKIEVSILTKQFKRNWKDIGETGESSRDYSTGMDGKVPKMMNIDEGEEDGN